VQAADLRSTTRLVEAVTQICYNARDYTALNANISLLSKKHGQLKAAVQAMVELAMGWLDEIRERDGTERWLELIETLRAVSEGKVRLFESVHDPTAHACALQIFLETPRARVTLALALHHESLAQAAATSSTKPSAKQLEELQTASDLLSDLQVETYSSMDRREKTKFILEQMRLLIAVAREKDKELAQGGKDALGGGEAEWVKVRVGGRKINEAFLTEENNEVWTNAFIHAVCSANIRRT
jgi:26S proteasome regulatory subunit N5